MSTLLIEIGVEEIPAGYIQSATQHLAAKVVAATAEFGATSDNARIFYTPRRMAVVINSIEAEIAATDNVLQGPPAKHAFVDGNPSAGATQALVGFCKKNQVDIDKVTVGESGRVEVVQSIPAQSIASVITNSLDSIARSIPWPKSMVWEPSQFRFARPIRSLCIMVDDSIIDCELVGIASSNQSPIHRSHGGGQATTKFCSVTATTYVDVLRDHHVLADASERKATIEQQLIDAATSLGADVERVRADQRLIDELTNIVEWPTVLVGFFEDHFLNLPSDLVKSPMIGHQRYMPLYADNGDILSKFLFVSNSLSNKPDVIIDGNSKVVRARLQDAQFHWDQDAKCKLADRLDDLHGVIYHADIGTYGDKVNAQLALVDVVSAAVNVDAALLTKATELAFADLATNVVYEFPELAGAIGRIYAARDQENQDVVTALEDGLLPKSASGELPATKLGTARSLIDRIETLSSFFKAGIQPTGSKDPFALRRAAIGLCRLAERENIDLQVLFRETLDDDTLGVMAEFMAARWEKELSSQHSREWCKAVTAIVPLEPASARRRVETIAGWQKEGTLEGILDSYKRLQNVLGKDPVEPVDLAASSSNLDGERQVLFAHLSTLSSVDAIAAAIPELPQTLSKFFDSVMINDEDASVRRTNRALVAYAKDVIDQFANFALIVGG